MDATYLAGLVRSGQASPRELTEAAIERIEALNGDLNAVIQQCLDVPERLSEPLGFDGCLVGHPVTLGILDDADMAPVNLANATLKYDPEDPEGFRAGMFRPGPDLGAELTGTTLYELPPGELLCPYHYEYGEEEWLLVLAGRPFLRTPDGTRELAPLDLAFFPRGPEGAHQVGNRGEEPARVLMWSNVAWPTATAYPDSDKVGIWAAPGDSLMVERESGVDYYRGENP